MEDGRQKIDKDGQKKKKDNKHFSIFHYDRKSPRDPQISPP